MLYNDYSTLKNLRNQVGELIPKADDLFDKIFSEWRGVWDSGITLDWGPAHDTMSAMRKAADSLREVANNLDGMLESYNDNGDTN